MATINVTGGVGGLTHPSAHAKVYQGGYVAVKVPFAEAASRKGSALAAGDVIRLIEVPAGAFVKHATAKVNAPVPAGTTALTVTVTESATSTEFLAGYNVKTATVGVPTVSASGTRAVLGQTAGYIDVTIATLTGDAPTSGELTVGIEFLDLTDRAQNAGLATRT